MSEALSVCQELTNPRGIAWSLDVFAGLLAAGGEVDGAARLTGASTGLLESVRGAIMPPLDLRIRERYLEPVRATLGNRSLPADLCQGTRDARGGGDCARAAAVRSAPPWTSWNSSDSLEQESVNRDEPRSGDLRAVVDADSHLVDTRTDFPLWSERYNLEMQEAFEVQDEIARKIAEALRVTLAPQGQGALAAKPTDNLRA